MKDKNLISIPYSSIKSGIRRYCGVVRIGFQFHIVRLKACGVPLEATVPIRFQFHIVRLKALLANN